MNYNIAGLRAMNSAISSATEASAFVYENNANISNIEVDSFDGLLIDYFNAKNADVIVKGLRAPFFISDSISEGT